VAQSEVAPVPAFAAVDAGASPPPGDSLPPKVRRWLSRGLLAATGVILLVLLVPRLAPGVCFGDGGGLQLASVTLGITHPPGYAVYASLGYLVSRIPGLDPPYAINLACLSAGIIAVLICAGLQIRLGVHPAVACAVSLLVAGHPRVWWNLQEPEVYMPTLALLACTTWLLLSYARSGRRSRLLLAAFCWGIAMAARPPVLFTLPGLLLAWWYASRRWERSGRASARSFGIATLAAASPVFYAFGYTWVRDAPDTPYNYIEQYNHEFHVVPPVEAGPKAKFERVMWQMTARQFAGQMGNTGSGIRSKLRWLQNDLFVYRPARCSVLALAALGGIVTYRRSRTLFWMLSALAVGGSAFVCLYQVYGDAADTLPVIFAVAVFSGAVLSVLLPEDAGLFRSGLALGLFGFVVAYTFIDAPHRSHAGQAADATRFLDELDVATLPPRALVCSPYHYSTPLWYAQTVLTDRDDILVLNAGMDEWQRLSERERGRPLFATVEPGRNTGFTATPYRNIWRLERAPLAEP